MQRIIIDDKQKQRPIRTITAVAVVANEVFIIRAFSGINHNTNLLVNILKQMN